jgi:hypothetical protein
MLSVNRSFGGTPLPIIRQPDPVPLVTKGSSVYTSEGFRIGTVKQCQESTFKVGTPLFHRDFWLPAVAIASAEPGGPVQLWLDRDQLEAHKQTGPSGG